MLPIVTIAKRAGIPAKYLELYGNFKAKVSLGAIKRSKGRGKYIVVTGITPTHLGEGKTVTAIGLAMALAKTGKKAIACLRQPSLGPLFGVKGGGLGGGRSEIIPQEDITGMETMRSVLGARSNKLARWQDYYITASKNEKRIKAEKQDILDDLEDKIRSGDIKSKEAFREFWKEEVLPFNRTYPDPDFIITEDTVARSMKGRATRSARNVQGLQVSAKSAERRLRAAEPFKP